jgi:hypothetical protein
MRQKAQRPDYTGLFETSASSVCLLELDLDIHARGQIQLHQRVDRFVGRVDDVHQALVGADFHLVARGLVDVRRTQQVEALDAGRQRHGTTDHSTGALGGVDDLEGRR